MKSNVGDIIDVMINSVIFYPPHTSNFFIELYSKRTFNLPKRYENFLCNYSLPNNGSWYREYSFGWLEQGGWSSSNNTNIILPKPMLSNDYTLVGGGRGWVPAQYANSAEANHFQQRSTTQFNGYGTYGFSWYIKGRGADAHPMIYLMIKYI